MADAEIAAVGEEEPGESLPIETVEALRFAQVMSRDPHGMDSALIAALRGRYGDAGVVELASVVGLCNYFNRFTSVFHVEPSGPGPFTQPLESSPTLANSAARCLGL